jgi:hypothetical protein
MFVVSSAQSAPMISPYVDSGQYQGMLVGLAGGASYEQLRQYPATASAYWDAYQVGVLVLIVLILIGGLYALGQELIRQSRQNSGDAS